MRIAKIRTSAGTTRYAVVEGASVQPVEGDLFGSLKRAGKPLALAEVELLTPLVPPSVLGLGLNYRGHVKDGKTTVPKEPILFLKHAPSVIGPVEAIVLPAVAPTDVDYEAELAVVIGRTARNSAVKFPADRIAAVLADVRALRDEEEARLAALRRATSAAEVRTIFRGHAYGRETPGSGKTSRS